MTDSPTLTHSNSTSNSGSETRSAALSDSYFSLSPSDDTFVAAIETSGRYRILAELGRGGMGVVYRAMDQLLGREIAVKVLKDCSHSSSSIRRFMDEALVTSQLQHPAIPSTYDLVIVDGKPFLTMKLIKGETLNEKIKACKSPAERAELIAAFEQVCQAMAYAHGRNIIHRDLKPSNIMVGAFGEVQVMDWGLAKKLDNRSEFTTSSTEVVESANAIRTSREVDSDATLPGSVLGTPAFAPPEQALGQIDKIDERVDVFGLGAVLCTILTGKPPYVSETPEAARVMAIRGELADAFQRLEACGADSELVELCRDCLSRDLQNRPRNAKYVADGVAAYRTGVELRLIAAKQAVVVAAAEAREQRKRKRIQFALIATLISMAAGVSSGLLWNRNRQIESLAVAENSANALLDKADQLTADTAKHDSSTAAGAQVIAALWQEAMNAAEQAESTIDAAGDPELSARIASRANSIREGLKNSQAALARAKRDSSFLESLEKAHGMSADLTRSAPQTAAAEAYKVAFAHAGYPPLERPEELVEAIATERAELRSAILISLDHWAWCLKAAPEAELIRRVADLVDGDPFRKMVRSAIARASRTQLIELAEQPKSNELPPLTATLLGRALNDCSANRAAAKLLHSVQERNPNDYWVLIELSRALWDIEPEHKPRWTDSISCLRAALALRPKSAMANFWLGAYLFAHADEAGSEAYFERAVNLDANLLGAWFNLALARDRRGDLVGAERCYRKALECDPLWTVGHDALGLLLLRRASTTAAECEFRTAIACDGRNASAHSNLAFVLEKKGNIADATNHYRLAVEYNPRLAQAQSNLGEALRWNGKWEESESSLRKSIDLNASLSESHKNLAVVLLLRGKHSEAEAAARKASELAPTDAESLGLLGSILERRGDLEAALDRFKAAARCDPADQFTYRFEIARLNGNPSRAEDLNRLLEEEIERHPKWSAAQKRTCKTQAAIAAVRCGYKPRSDSNAIDRRGFRQLAAKLFASILCEFSSALESSPADAPLEAVSATANWLGDKELAPIRNLLQLLMLPPDESAEWAKIWSNVGILRTKLLRPQ